MFPKFYPTFIVYKLFFMFIESGFVYYYFFVLLLQNLLHELHINLCMQFLSIFFSKGYVDCGILKNIFASLADSSSIVVNVTHILFLSVFSFVKAVILFSLFLCFLSSFYNGKFIFPCNFYES